MDFRLTCKNCGVTIAAETEDEFVVLARDHAASHGHRGILTREHIFRRLRRVR